MGDEEEWMQEYYLYGDNFQEAFLCHKDGRTIFTRIGRPTLKDFVEAAREDWKKRNA